MFRQDEKLIEENSKNREKAYLQKKAYRIPDICRNALTKKENHAFGYTADTVIQRRPSYFSAYAVSERESDIHSVVIMKRQSNSEKVELTMEEYAAWLDISDVARYFNAMSYILPEDSSS